MRFLFHFGWVSVLFPYSHGSQTVSIGCKLGYFKLWRKIQWSRTSIEHDVNYKLEVAYSFNIRLCYISFNYIRIDGTFRYFFQPTEALVYYEWESLRTSIIWYLYPTGISCLYHKVYLFTLHSHVSKQIKKQQQKTNTQIILPQWKRSSLPPIYPSQKPDSDSCLIFPLFSGLNFIFCQVYHSPLSHLTKFPL